MFDLTANINARTNASNLRAVADQLRRQLSVTATVNVQLARGTGGHVAGLTGRFRSLNAELNLIAQNSTNATASLNNLAGAFQNLARNLNVTVTAQRNLNNLGNTARNAGTQMEQFGRSAGLALRRFAGFTIVSRAVGELFSAISGGTKEAIAFQRQLVRISQVSGQSLTSLRSLTDEITRLSTSLGVSSSELIDVSRILRQAGLSTNETRIALEALAKSSLAPTFTDIANTAEGAVAVFSQFRLEANQLEQALGSINAVSGQFAVESDDIVAAVKRAGGVFASTSEGVVSGIEALNQFVATFASVRATTREGAETIATGLRTIFTRIQRPTTIAFLQDLGVNLLDVEGKFVGPFEAVNRLSSALANLDTRDPQFARIVEELGGFRQVGKVIPLLTQQETRLKALAVAQQGVNSLTEDAETAQEALAVQFTKVKEEFLALAREFVDTGTFKTLVKTLLDLTRGFIQLADAIKPVLPLIAAVGVVRGGAALAQFGSGLFRRGGVRFHSGGYVGRQAYASGGDVRVRGMVPGGKGNRDDFPATLQTGEFVIRRKAVDAIGRQNLERLNRAQGGPVLSSQNNVGAAILFPFDEEKNTPLRVSRKEVPSLPTANKSFTFRRQALGTEDKKIVDQQVTAGVISGLQKGAKDLGGISLNRASASNIFNTVNPSGILGSMFEGILLAINNRGVFDSVESASRPFDFETGFNSILGQKFENLRGVNYIDAKLSARAAQPEGIRKKIIRQLNLEASIQNSRRGKSPKAPLNAAEQQKLDKVNKRKANLGLPLRRNQGGDVPALLTRGEFVFNRRAARNLGGPALNLLNNADRLNQGGFAGRQKFVGGGAVLGRILAFLGNRRLRRFIDQRGAGALNRTGFGGPSNLDRAGSGNAALTAGILAGGVFGDSPVGRTASGAISGGALGASVGSVIPGVGTAVGAVIGTIAGSFNAFTQSKLDEKIKESTSNIQKAIADLNTSFQSFEISGDLSDLAESSNDINAAINGVREAENAQRGLGITGRFTRSTLFNRGTALTPDQRAALQGRAGAVGASAVGFDVRNAFGVRASSVQQAVANQEDFNLSFGNRLRSEFGDIGERIGGAIQNSLSSGESIDDILDNLGTGNVTAFATSVADRRQLSALGGAVDEEQANLIARNIARENIRQSQEQLQQQRALAQAVRNSAVQLDTFKETIEDISAVVARVGDAGSDFSRRNAALIGNGIISTTSENPFANIRAFGDRELANASRNVVQSLGGSTSSGLGGDLFGAVASFNDVRRRLPGVIANAARNSTGGSEDLAVEQAIRQNFRNLPSSLIDGLVAGFSSSRTGKDGSTIRDFATNDAAGLAEEVLKPVIEAFKRVVEVQNSAITEYESAVGQWISLQENANNQFIQTVQRDVANRNQIIGLDRKLTFGEETEGFRRSVEERARFVGAGGSDLGSILTRLSQIDSERQALQVEASAAQRTVGRVDDNRAVIDRLGALSLEQRTTESILQDIASNTQISAAAGNRLVDIENSKKSAQQLAEEFLTADRPRRRELERGIGLARNLEAGGEISRRNADITLQGTRALGVLRGTDPEVVERQVRQFLSRNPEVQDFFRQGGRTAREALVGGGTEERTLRGVLAQQRQIQQTAGLALANRGQDRASEFLGNANQRLDAVLNNLSQILVQAANTFASLPNQIATTIQGTVNVNITGAQALASIEPTMRRLIDNQVKRAIRQAFPDASLESTGGPLTP